MKSSFLRYKPPRVRASASASASASTRKPTAFPFRSSSSSSSNNNSRSSSSTQRRCGNYPHHKPSSSTQIDRLCKTTANTNIFISRAFHLPHPRMQQQRCFSTKNSNNNNNNNKTCNNDIYNNDNNDPWKASNERIRQDHKYCVDLVRDRDREGYLCGLLMPQSIQKSFFALQAWNVEVASIKDGSARLLRGGADATGSGSIAVQLKFQRWRDILEAIYDSSAQDDFTTAQYASDPVACGLARAVHDHNLTRRFLERLLEAREQNVEVVQPSTVAEITRYAEQTLSSRLYLTLELLDCRQDAADIVASHAGVGIGIVTQCLRAAPFRVATMGEIPVPVELLPPSFPYSVLPDLVDFAEDDNSNNNNPQQSSSNHTNTIIWPSLEDQQAWEEAVQQVAMVATGHLQKAQELQSDIPKHARSVLLPMIPAMQYLTKLETRAIHWNVFDPQLRGIGGGVVGANQRWDRLQLLLYMSRSWLTGVY